MLDYASYEHILAATLLVLSMLGLGATLHVADFWQAVRSPRGIALVLVIQLAIMPCVAVAITAAFGLPWGIGAGMLLVAALPGGAYSNLLTHLGRGNVTLSISATTLCTVACVLTIPLVISLFGHEDLLRGKMPVAQIMREILWFLLIPLAVGMWLRRPLGDAREPFSKWCLRGSLFVLFLIVAGSLQSGRIELGRFGWQAPTALIVFGLISLGIGYALSFAVGFARAEAFTIATEVTARNGNIGLLLKATLFPATLGTAGGLHEGVLFAVLFYAGASLVIVGTAVAMYRLRTR